MFEQGDVSASGSSAVADAGSVRPPVVGAPWPDLHLPPGPELAAALAAVPLGSVPGGAVPGGAVSEVSDAMVVDVVAGWERVKCWAEAGQAAALVEFAGRRRGPDGCGGGVSEFAADEIAAALCLARGTAGHRIAFALGLVALPATRAALAGGRIGLGVAHRIVDGLAALSAAAAMDAETTVLTDAVGRTPGQVQARVAHTVLAVDPGAARARHARAVTDRRVELYAQPDGMATLWALLPADDAVLVMASLRGQADAARTPGDTRTHAQRVADALVDLHTAPWRNPHPTARPPATVPATVPGGPAATVPGGSAATVPGGLAATVPGQGCPHCEHRRRGGDGPRVRVVVAATTLLGLDEQPGELAGYGPVPAEVARRLAADPTGTWQRILTDPVSGALLDVGRTRYTPPAALADHIRARDRTCRFPGCRMPAERCDLDHIRRYPDGPTSHCNLCTECRHHHRLKHETGWQIHNDPADPATITWTSPTGHPHTTRARPPLVPV
jgi:hypothetical protein